MKIESEGAKFVPVVITIESLEEAQAIVDVFSRVGGSQTKTLRKHTQKINDFLASNYRIRYRSESYVTGAVRFEEDDAIEF